MQKRFTLSTAVLLGAALATPAFGQVVVGSDDFQGGGVFTSRVFSPDNTATNGVFTNPDGSTGSFFDRFGIVDPGNPDVGAPFDFLDDSANGFPTDTLGIFGSTDRDPFLGFADLVNGQNSDPVTVDWTFDIAGFSGLNLALDFGAVGNFGDDETVTIQASVDGGPAQTLFLGSGTADEEVYTLALESGTVVDRYDNIFFNELTWLELVDFGPAGDLDFAASDVDMDGFNDDTGERTFFNDPFTNDERIVFDQQFSVNGVGLNNVLQTLDADILGSGTELTVTLTASQNGGFQLIGIDDLVLTGIEDVIGGALEGDYNGDGFVAQADLDLVLLNFGSSLLPEGFDASAVPDGVGFDGLISQNELDGVLLNFGNGTPPVAGVSAIPEPTSLALLGLGGLALGLRRRA